MVFPKAHNPRRVGREGEEQAARFLTAKGYRLLERNYRGERGEIDIIAQQGSTLVFVEVKTAKGLRFGEPETWVTPRKQQQIGKVAAKYLQEHDITDMDCRFDVVAIARRGARWQITHLENAFWL